ncbi:hypothetical protein PHYPSEUDO_000245 [Phytophthora pseudosyringae]|uniref:Uncharacterized protein n=1 Tax=Phytophthora pseudosyringae TaxID=221518 RepID=A0A8T1WFJ7_9STRA|nr:hypothetical protein PHYPSEUDO_000245 [Phytophthora pseudosyringae]
MRIVPVQREAKQQQEREPTNVAVQSNVDGDGTGTRARSRDTTGEHLYELELAQALPAFELNKTLASKLLPSALHGRLCLAMHSFLNRLLVRLFRISLLCFGCLLFVPVKFILPGVPLMVAAIVLPPVIFVTFFSLDVLLLLACHYEFWFITALNTLNWVGLGVIFGDIRAISCIGLWLSSQSVVLIDSNYRTFPTAVKSIIISGPFLILLVVCCSYNLVADASYPAIELGKLKLQSRQVVVFTASTLSLFVVKKAYTKNYRLRIRLRDRESDPDTAQGQHTIPCVGLHARLKLSHLGAKRSMGQVQFGASTMRNLVALAPRSRSAVDAAAVSNIQQLKLAPHDPFTVDARNVVLSGKLLKWMEAPYAQSAVYITGVVGLSATAIVWLMILYHHEQGSTDQLKVCVATVAAVCSLIFMFVMFSLAQRDLLRLVAWNFDVLFSTFQGTALTVCLLDLLRWNAPSNLAVIAWWLWFHCLLVLDALTPSLTRQLNIRKHFGLPAVIVMLSVAAGCALELIIGDADGVFSSRLLCSVRLSGAGFDLHTSTLAIQRTITIVGWFPRLLLELATGRPDQLLFIHRQVEFLSPHPTFSDPAPSDTVAAARQET